ncbi:hypothetical protein DACRYDRAFT_100934 [Dacryopinax primogenitus]|uniref:Uncharacterized protein n=1 Tax=Dacryopinax primogenitus (strain DJM 731) TaxID=1858805 RepID=M5G9D5_DACPD|nr:uncharacterized protein DACRYDRAFT_100934 [Dacryopinax primogenitus]EJU00403.1 hypothetical protein DACRYDRAFT_100934 [Dacryopinax primogenitus]
MEKEDGSERLRLTGVTPTSPSFRHDPSAEEGREAHSARGVRIRTIATLAFLPVLLAIALLLVFALWFFTRSTTTVEQVWQHGVFLLNEGDDGQESNMTGLTISSILSQAISLVSPWVLSLFAYRIAVLWTRDIQRHHYCDRRARRRVLPNPYEHIWLACVAPLVTKPDHVWHCQSPAVHPRTTSPSCCGCPFLFLRVFYLPCRRPM